MNRLELAAKKLIETKDKHSSEKAEMQGLRERLEHLCTREQERMSELDMAWRELEEAAIEFSAQQTRDPKATYDPETDAHGQLWKRVFGDKPEL